MRTVVSRETGTYANDERQRSALIVLAVCAGLASVALAFGVAALPTVVLLGVGGYLVASRLPRRLSIPAPAAAGTGLGGALLYAATAIPRDPLIAATVESFLPRVPLERAP